MKHSRLGPVISVANQKGGVGKTTTSINLAASLAALDRRVLLIDLDPQGNSTSGLGIEKKELEASTYRVLMRECSLQEAVVNTAFEGLYLVPASIDLAGAEVELVNASERECALYQGLQTFEGDAFDFVLVDCPPTLNLLTVNALTASDRVLITLQAEFYAMEGLSQLMDTIRMVRGGLNPQLTVDGILLTMMDRRNNLALQVEQEVREYFGNQVYRQVIPRNVRLSEAPSFGVPVMHYDVKSTGAGAYLAMAQEFMHRQILHGGAS